MELSTSSFCKNVRKLRMEHHLSVREMAAILELSEEKLLLLESGTLTDEMDVGILAIFFSISVFHPMRCLKNAIFHKRKCNDTERFQLACRFTMQWARIGCRPCRPERFQLACRFALSLRTRSRRRLAAYRLMSKFWFMISLMAPASSVMLASPWMVCLMTEDATAKLAMSMGL
mgnify:CR=1 FL=1